MLKIVLSLVVGLIISYAQAYGNFVQPQRVIYPVSQDAQYIKIFNQFPLEHMSPTDMDPNPRLTRDKKIINQNKDTIIALFESGKLPVIKEYSMGTQKVSVVALYYNKNNISKPVTCGVAMYTTRDTDVCVAITKDTVSNNYVLHTDLLTVYDIDNARQDDEASWMKEDPTKVLQNRFLYTSTIFGDACAGSVEAVLYSPLLKKVNHIINNSQGCWTLSTTINKRGYSLELYTLPKNIFGSDSNDAGEQNDLLRGMIISRIVDKNNQLQFGVLFSDPQIYSYSLENDILSINSFNFILGSKRQTIRFQAINNKKMGNVARNQGLPFVLSASKTGTRYQIQGYIHGYTTDNKSAQQPVVTVTSCKNNGLSYDSPYSVRTINKNDGSFRTPSFVYNIDAQRFQNRCTTPYIITVSYNGQSRTEYRYINF